LLSDLGSACLLCIYVLQLRLNVLQGFIETGDARLQLVDGIIHALHLPGELIDLVSSRALLLHLLLQTGQGLRHAIHVIGGLFHQVLEHTHALVVGLLEALQHVLQGLDLLLELDNFL
jgi:hypothetical protein